MREIRRIIIHCAATRPEQDVGVAEIDRWHRERGWNGIGYHYVIRRNGLVETGRSEERMGAHVRGHNADSIGVCLAGGHGSSADDAPEDHYTPEQLRALPRLIGEIQGRYPGATVHGHNEYAAKACPGFRVAGHWSRLSAPEPPAQPDTTPPAPAPRRSWWAALWRALTRSRKGD
jgi:N-acetylmuramoyl-L-alanine amidase